MPPCPTVALMASPDLTRWRNLDGSVPGMEATWVNATRVRIPTDYYYLAAKWPLLPRLAASETWDRFRLPLPNGNFSVVLASVQGNYSFNRFLTFTSLVQMDTSNAQAVSANLRLRYNYRSDSDLYVIYNVGTQFASIAPSNPPQVRETRFAIKWTYSWQP